MTIQFWKWTNKWMWIATVVVVLLASRSWVTTTTAFNLEPRIALRKQGPIGSYFGLAVSPHQILVDDHQIDSTLLVGAPLDTYGTDYTKATGVLYQCPFTSKSDDCVKVHDIPTNRDARSLAEAAGQWLGVSVFSQGPGKQVIVCAHRYVKNETDQRWGQGQCFTLTQDLKHSATWDPCEGRAKNSAHEEWGFCQAGTSALLTEDQTALIGAPGPYTWRGTVFAYSVEDDYLFRDKTHYHIPVQEGEAPVDKYAYLGMSVASGNFLPSTRTCGNRLSYAVGAPRSDDRGAVFIFFKCKSIQKMRVDQSLRGEKFASSFGYSLAAIDMNGDGFTDLIVGAPFYQGLGAVYIYMNSPIKGIHSVSETYKLVGTEHEGRFGFSVAHAGDLDNDGFDDLVIGAPYAGKGRLYVYLGSQEFQPTSKNPDQIILAEELPYPGIRTFGYSLSGGYDLDLNNHSDVVVGAYGSDSAFVIRSRPVIDIDTWFKDLRIHYIDPTLTGCEGDIYSPEFCFTIESCFLIKNFPDNIASIHLRYILSAEVFPGGRRVSRIRFGDASSNSTHFSEKTVIVERGKLTGCFHETAYLKEGTVDLRTPVMFQLKLRLQQDEPQPQRTTSRISNINYFPILNQHQATKVLKLKFHESCGRDELCHSRLRASLAMGPGFDHSLQRLEVMYRQEILMNVTVSNTGEPAYSAELQVNIDPSFAYVGRSDDVTDIHCDFRGRGLGVRCLLGNPYASNRTDSLLFRVVPSQSSPFVQKTASFSVVANTSSEDIGETSDRTHEFQVRVIKRAELSMRSLLQPDQIWYGGLVRSESQMRIMSDIGSKLTHTFQVTNDGPWHVETFDVLIEWPHRLAASEAHPQGKWLLYLTEMPEVTPPGIGECFVNSRHVNALGLRDAIRRPLLYSSTTTNRRPPPSRPYNKYEAANNDNKIIQKRRRRRSPLQHDEQQLLNVIQSYEKEAIWLAQHATSNSLADITLDCADPEVVQCHTLTCRIHGGLRANESAVVRLRSRVWNSTLVEEYGSLASTVAIHARAHLELPDELDLHQELWMDDTTVATLWAYPDASILGDSHGLESVPTWIIVVSVVVGLFVVSLIAATLYKLGFFQRNRVPEDVMISAKVTSVNGGHYAGQHSSRLEDYIS